MITVGVPLAGRSYDVLIGAGLLGRAAELLAPYGGRGRLVVVTDENVAHAQLPRLQRALGEAPWARSLSTIVVPAGERSKGWAELARLVSRLIAEGVERDDHILALGGGMVGDLAGFAAAILKRGCGYVQLPTSLLAQVDSSVGGKTAINTPEGKNLVGAFHQPSAALIDIDTLATLPERQLRAGYAEVVKYGLIEDPSFFGWCEENGPLVLMADPDATLTAVEHCVRAKAAIVAADERDTSGRRALLNLGHSFAHALEAQAGLSDRLLHGEAVAVGMVLAFRLSAQRGLCSDEEAERVERHLSAAGLPTRLSQAGIGGEGLLGYMATDKKRSSGRLRLILVKGIGKAFVADDVSEEELAAFLKRQG